MIKGSSGGCTSRRQLPRASKSLQLIEAKTTPHHTPSHTALRRPQRLRLAYLRVIGGCTAGGGIGLYD